jgi:Zn-dependent alcohol dehydrogenase
MNTSPVFPGARVAVIGCGGVGLSVIQGAKLQHARQIIAVDVNPTKLDWAKQFGATHVVNAREVDPVQKVRELTDDGWDGGVEFAYEATGIPVCTEQAVKMLSYGGTATTIGFPGRRRRRQPQSRRHGDRRVLEQGRAPRVPLRRRPALP